MIKHIVYHGQYSKRADIERDAVDYLPKDGAVEFAHKFALSRKAEQMEPAEDGKPRFDTIYTETAVVFYTKDKRIYGLNLQREIVNGDASDWKRSVKANLDPMRELARIPDRKAFSKTNAQADFVDAMRKLYERLAAIRSYWDEGREPEESELPKLSWRLTGTGVPSAGKN